jgi:hypothetical protein
MSGITDALELYICRELTAGVQFHVSILAAVADVITRASIQVVVSPSSSEGVVASLAE